VAELPGGDAAPLTAFNLNEERGEGHFDEEGNFVFDKEDPNDQDEWLRSDEGAPLAGTFACVGVRQENNGAWGCWGMDRLCGSWRVRCVGYSTLPACPGRLSGVQTPELLQHRWQVGWRRAVAGLT
jgi:hypothetical protein